MKVFLVALLTLSVAAEQYKRNKDAGLDILCQFAIYKVAKNETTLKATDMLERQVKRIQNQFDFVRLSATEETTVKIKRTADDVLEDLQRRIMHKETENQEVEEYEPERRLTENSGKKVKKSSKREQKTIDYVYQVEISCGLTEFNTIYNIVDSIRCSIDSQFFKIALDIGSKRIQKTQPLDSLRDARIDSVKNVFVVKDRVMTALLPIPIKKIDECMYVFQGESIWGLGGLLGLVLTFFFQI
jgi:hypothetical protein